MAGIKATIRLLQAQKDLRLKIGKCLWRLMRPVYLVDHNRHGIVRRRTNITRDFSRRPITRLATRVPLQFVVAGFLLIFGLVRVTPGAVESFGSRFMVTDETVRLKLPRGGLRVRAADAARYEALVTEVQGLANGRTLWAGPDAPEVYFLSGVPNKTRTLFDFLDVTTATLPVIERVRAAQATLVVLKLQPDFSRPPDSTTVTALRAGFPNARGFPGFIVFWR